MKDETDEDDDDKAYQGLTYASIKMNEWRGWKGVKGRT